MLAQTCAEEYHRLSLQKTLYYICKGLKYCNVKDSKINCYQLIAFEGTMVMDAEEREEERERERERERKETSPEGDASYKKKRI